MKILILNYNKGGSKSFTIITNRKVQTFNGLTGSIPNYLRHISFFMSENYYDELFSTDLTDFKKIKKYSKQFDLVLYFKYGQLLKKWRNEKYKPKRKSKIVKYLLED